MNAAEVGIFIDGAARYFEVATTAPASIGSPYLATNERQRPGSFSGVIEITGRRRGRVCFTAPGSMLAMILGELGDRDAGEAQLADLVGEIANIISGHARKQFGRHFRISVPRVERSTAGAGAESVLVIPIAWREQEARVILRLA